MPSVWIRGLLASYALLVAAPALAQNIRVEKYKLDNGLTVILHEDHALPQVVVNLWYRVGALDEPPGRSGFAHLFEHLMFMGTRRVPGNQFDVVMETGGGANNASTDLYRTNYFSWGPAKLLPTLLWLDADRLEDMGLNMSQAKLDKQRDVVRNELRQTIENTPYGRAGELIFRLMYPPDHPYHNSVAGTHQDLEAATVDNVRDFFANFYVPNNASLVVAGDFDPAVVKPMIAQLFGTIARGADVPRRTPPPAKLDRVRRYTVIDKVQLPKISMAWHSPVAYAEGDAELKLAAAVLAEGKASRLYKRLVYEDQIASEVSASQSSSQVDSLFQVEVLAKPDADLAQVERAIDEELARLCKDGPTAEELTQRQATLELSMLNRLQSLLGRADQLNEYEYFWGEPNSFQRDLDRFRSVTTAGVRDWAARTLLPDARAIIRVLPEEPERPASTRDQRPADAPDRAFAPPPPEEFTLRGGLRCALWNRPELPLVGLMMQFKPGPALDPIDRAGLADLTTTMLSEGAGERDALQFGQALQALGADFDAAADREAVVASLIVLKRNFAPAAELFADALRRPRLTASDWERVKALHLDDLKQSDEEPTVVAERVAARLLFGDQHRYGWPVAGTIDTVSRLTLDDIRAAHAALLNPTAAKLLIAGDISADEARKVLDGLLGDWQPAATTAAVLGPREFPAPRPARPRVAIVDRPEAVQTVIRFEMPGVAYGDPQRVPLRLLNTLLGGSFTSRLNQNLREDHGYTYGARSRFAMEPSAGSFAAYAEVKADTTGAALREFFKEFERLRTGDVTDAEATKVREMVRNNTIQGFQGLRGLLNAFADPLAAGLPFATLADDLRAIESVNTATLNQLGRPALPLEQSVLVLVGDAKLIREQIRELNLPPAEEFDVFGNPAAAEGASR